MEPPGQEDRVRAGAVAATSERQAAAMTALLGRLSRDPDRETFRQLFVFFAPRVKAYMRRLGAEDALAEDLAQETLLQVWRKAHRYDATRAAASTWIFTVARNLRIDALRRERRPEVLENEPAMQPEAPPAADEVLLQSEREARVRHVLRDLPAAQAQVLQLSFFEDKSHSAIAEQLDLPLGTVKSRLRLSMQKVREALADVENHRRDQGR